MSDYLDTTEPPEYSVWEDITGEYRRKKNLWNIADDARRARVKEANRRVYLQGYLRRDPGVYSQWDEKDRSLLPPELRQRFDSLEEQNNLGTPSPFRLPISAQAPAQPRSDFASGEGGGGDFDVAQPRSPLLEALAKPDAQNQTPVSKPASTPVTISPAMMPRIGTNLGSDEDLTTRIPLLQSLTQPTREHFIFGPQSNSLVKPMFSGPGDMADRRLAVLERTDPEAAAALRQKLAQVQAQHQVEQQYNALHDQARTPAHYGRDVETDGGPLFQSEVQGLVNKQKEQEYLTGNPGMRRFLGGQPVQDAPAKFALMDSLTEGVRRDNNREYGTVAGRRASRPIGSPTWAIERRSVSELRPDEIKAIDNAPSQDTLRQNGERYKARQQARHEGFQAKKAEKEKQQYELALAQAKGGGITGDQMDYALRVAQQNPAMMPLLRSFIEGRSNVAAAQAQANGRGDANDWHQQQMQAQIDYQQKKDRREYLLARMAAEPDPAKKEQIRSQLDMEFGIQSAPAAIPVAATATPAGAADQAYRERAARQAALDAELKTTTDPARYEAIQKELEEEKRREMRDTADYLSMPAVAF